MSYKSTNLPSPRMSTTTESSGSPYQSDGEIPCCFTKRYDSTCSEDSEKDTPDSRDAEEPAHFWTGMGISRFINQLHNSDEPEERLHVYPVGSEQYLEPLIFNNIKSLARGKGSFVFVSSGLMKDLKMLHKTRVPPCVICDICIFTPEKPVTLLTFVATDNRLSQIYSYTSRLARAMTSAVRGSLASFQLVHGVVTPDTWRSSSAFSEKMEELVAATSRTAIPHSMENCQSDCITALAHFLELIKDNPDIILGSSPTVAPAENASSCISPVVTRAFEKTIDVLRQQRHAVVTGGPGEGKTTVAHMLCRLYQQRGYQTVFFKDFEEADLTVISEVKVPFLLVIDDMFKSENTVEHQSFLKSVEKHIEENDVILVMVCQLYHFKKAQKLFQTYLLGNCSTIDITSINSSDHRNTCVERYHLLQCMGINVTSSELIKISNIKPYTPGFATVCNDFPKQTVMDPVDYFSYPHRYLRRHVCCLLHQSHSAAGAALILLLINGGTLRRNTSIREDLLEAVKTVCPVESEETIFDELQYLSGSFLATDERCITFQSRVVYDACVFAVAKRYPDVLWNICNIRYLSTDDWPISESSTDILMSKQNLHHFIKDLVDRLQKRQFEKVSKSPFLLSEENVDFLIASIGTNVEEILNTADVSEKGNLLYWTGHARNLYMTQLLLQRPEMSSDVVRRALSTCICLKKAHVFSYLLTVLKDKFKTFGQSDINSQDSDGQTLLLSSVRSADNDMVKVILKEGANPMVQDNIGNNSLHEACRLGNSDILRSLIAVKGININFKDSHSRTPMMIAAVNGHEVIFRILSGMEGCDQTCVDDDGNQALHLACLSGNIDIVQCIVTSGDVDLNRRGQYGKTPLMIATCEGHGDIFDALMSAGCEIDVDIDMFSVPTEQRFTNIRNTIYSVDEENNGSAVSSVSDENHAHRILHKLAINGHYQLLQFLLTKNTVNLNCTNSLGRTPVMTAAMAGHHAVYDLFVSKGCSLDVTDKDGCNILHLACKTGRTLLIENLLKQRDIDINSKDKTNKSAVMHAVEGGHLEAFVVLRDKCDLLCKDEDGNNLLHLACIGGCVDIVELLISSGSFDSRNLHGRTPAMVAASAGHRDIHLVLRRRGFDFDAIDTKGRSCFCCACIGGNIDIVSDLLQHKRQFLYHRDARGRTPTMQAAEHGHMKVLVFLLDNGGDISEQDDNGNTLLHVACFAGNEGIVRAFLSGNTDINQRGHLGRTPIMMAAMSGHKRVFNLCLTQPCLLSTKDYHGNNLLHAACIGGNVQIVQWLLLQNLFDINSRGESGKTPIMMAAEHGWLEAFNLLVKEGSDPGILDERGNTILHVACIGGNVAIVRHLLSQCSLGVDCRGETGRTAVMWSAIGGHMELLTHLVQTGADLSLKDDDNNNIFHLACLGGSVEVCNLLLNLAADVCDLASRGRNGRTPIMMAAIKGHLKVFELLISKGCSLSELDDNRDSILHLACRGGNEAIVQYLLLQDVDLNRKGRHGRTQVMLAAWKGHVQVYFLLAKQGCHLTGEDAYGDNILHLACRGGRPDIVEHLISRGYGNTESRGQYGRTPVMMAAGKGCKQVVDLLIDNRCDLTAVDSNGNTVLHLACLSGKAWFVKYLLSKTTVDALQENDSKLSPDSVARYCGQREVFKLLQRGSR